ncbi:hypothetical protein [Pseudonocardia oroxyli]|uniref:Uncharacterized protein n=1 Tax=Pseudonocardia oroxyli TaxID=366584 RepID=A0A1G8CCM1_PSEOR|nr:hypothetical protein [Pseudonocardia oroxyli]SDH43155.1 hypothetical protein SAMN05216377_12259 [Pseudonocardia oroxyli]
MSAPERLSARRRELAPDRGQASRFGIRPHVITRDSADQAWAQADALSSLRTRGLDDA